MYQRYQEWCDDSGIQPQYQKTLTNFSGSMETKGFVRKRYATGMHFINVEIKGSNVLEELSPQTDSMTSIDLLDDDSQAM